jgi:hypothetical protein
MRMFRRVLLGGLVAMTFAALASAEDKTVAPAKNAGLDRIKKLAGTWVMADDKGQPTDKVVSVFKITANGSAVEETIFPGSDREMVSVYHLDGPDVVLTHYCALGNQPHLKLDAKGPANQLTFKFVSGSNMDPAKDMHMHEGSITWVDDDHITSQWAAYQNGKPMEDHKMSMNLVRKK